MPVSVEPRENWRVLNMLPRMTWGNWLFWGIMAFVGIFLLWVGVLELFVPLWVGVIVAVIVFIVLLVYCPREEEEDK